MQSHTLLTTIILGTLISQGFTKPMSLDNSRTDDSSSTEEEDNTNSIEEEDGPDDGLGNPDERGDGDMRGWEDLMGPPDDNPMFRNVINRKYWGTYLWTDGIVPYEFQEDKYLAVDELTRNLTLEAIEWLNDQSAIFGKACLQIRPKTPSDVDFIRFESRSGCFADVAKRGRGQIVSLGPGCAKKGVIAHEILHVLGFYHEQSRTDRDEYISVQWDNVKDGQNENFLIRQPIYITDKDITDYDFDSIMHYSAYAFNKESGLKTIIPKDNKLPKGILMGQRTHFSENDLKEIREMYGCTGPNGETYEDNSKRKPKTPKTKSEPKEKEGNQTKKIKKQNTAQSKNNKEDEGAFLFCDFESSSCKFSKDTSLDFGWTRSSGNTNTEDTGPSRDHTKGNKRGYYYYAEATGHAAQVGGTLSPKIPPGTYCLDFWFHMYGSQVGDFKVFLVEQGKKDRTKLLRTSGNQGDDWKNEQISIDAENKFQVAFVAAMKKNGDKGDVAIDDIRITSGSCQ
ncbi:unnamed protein product [Owenia fusiformis]|uniref:Metalloendopeptidase n=1 Tax=Owenia fusiformis TaxID=6347 RepID=A0A8S4PM42_OWEFU|nr:unnamed protein product [Owenia fusiformis]